MLVPILSVVSIGVSVLSALFAAGVYFRLVRMIRSSDEAVPRMIRAAEHRVLTAEGEQRKNMVWDFKDWIAHVREEVQDALLDHEYLMHRKTRRKKATAQSKA